MEEYPVTKVTFLRKHHEYGEVYSYFFKPEQPIVFTAGSYAHVRVLSLPETVRRVRELSIASSPQDPEILLTIDHVSGSDYQKAIQALTPGDVIEFFKIKSHLTWPCTEPHAVLIAGGIGITPFRSMLLDRKERNLPITTTLLHVSRDSYLYTDELSKIVSEYRATNREGLLKELDSITNAQPDAHYYVAGSLGFVDAIKQELTNRGITTIETDAFKGLPEESLIS